MAATEPVIVLGAGPAGIAAGIGLGERGLVLEECPELGGLCRTIHLDGAVFDWGGHSFHTPHAEVRDLVHRALEMHVQPRQARCFSQGVLIPYPFQAHYRELPDAAVVRECAEAAAAAEGAANFEDYLVGRFGAGIARHFLLPYNRKLWGADLRRLAVDWVDQRVAAPVGTPEQFDESGGRRHPLREDTAVAYPARGGFGEITLALARRLPRLRLGRRVTWIDPQRRELTTCTGERLRWRRLVSTLPLPRLLSLLADAPPRLTRLAARLEALPLALVLVVIGHPVDTPIQRIYCAGPELPAHKLVINHNSSPYLRSLPHHGILAEVALPPGTRRPAANLAAAVVAGLRSIGLIQSLSEVRRTKVIHVPQAYPVPTHERAWVVGELAAWLEKRGIHPLGRFGEWDYINSDEALRRGLTLGLRLAESQAAIRPLHALNRRVAA